LLDIPDLGSMWVFVFSSYVDTLRICCNRSFSGFRWGTHFQNLRKYSMVGSKRNQAIWVPQKEY
jgi:hypothetical protein